MTYVPGSASAEVLVRAGLSRHEVVGALMREIGLTYSEAERAWWTTASHLDDLDLPQVAAR
jgi:hypothetical protein